MLHRNPTWCVILFIHPSIINVCVCVAYRAFAKIAPYHDLRKRYENGSSQKQRQRFSLAYYRKFFGDYMKVQTQQALMQAIAVKNPAVNSEQPVFSYPGGIIIVFIIHSLSSFIICFIYIEAVIVPGIFGSPKISPRFIVLTNVIFFFFLQRKKKNKFIFFFF